jgi:predicted TPR repeat methyltransferase
MADKNRSLSEDYFNDVYSHHDDPWKFETSPYELAKYEATIAALPSGKYKNAFEIGCSIGVLTQMLAGRCDNLLSVDAAEAPLAKARQRLKGVKQVTIEKMMVPDQFPANQFDLILMSEVGYYLSMPDLQRLQELIISSLEVNGNLLLVHWTPFVPDYPLTGDEVHDSFMKFSGNGKPFKHLLHQQQKTYRLDLFEKQ